MGSIAAGTDYGQAVSQPRLVSEASLPAAAFGSNNTLREVGRRMEAQGIQEQRAVDAEREQLRREQDAARQRADAGVAQSKVYLQRDALADALGQIEAGVADGTIPKTDAERVWKERSAEVLSKAADGVPESHLQSVQLDGQTHVQSLSSKVAAAVRRRDQSDTLSALNTTLEYTQRLYATDPAKAREITALTLANQGPAAGLRPEQIQATQQKWVEQTAYTGALTAITAARHDNKALAAVEKALGENADIDPQRRAQLLAQVDGYKAQNEAAALRAAQHAEIVAARRQRESQHAYGILSSWAMAGKAANEQANAQLLAKLTPEDAAAYRSLAAEVPARTAAAMLPLDQQSRQLEAFYAARAANGTSERLEAEIKRREQVLAEAKRDYGAEPLRAAQERGILDTPLQPLNLSSIDAAVQGVQVRVDQARTAATRAGKPVSPLLSDEADKLGRLLQALPVAQRAERIQQLTSLLPADQGQALAGQMVAGQSEEKRALGIAFALGAQRTTNGRATAELALKGAEALKAKTIKEEKTPVDGWRGQIGKQLEGIYVSPQQAEMVGEAARLILAGMVAEGSSGSRSDAARAVKLATGGDMREWNGARVLLPAGIDLPDLKRTAAEMKPSDLAPQLVSGPLSMGSSADDHVYVNGRPVPVPDFIASLPGAKLRYIDGDAATGAEYAVEAGGTFVTNVKREPILITVRGVGR